MLDRLQAVFQSLRLNDVRYLVIGGIAAVLYGVPRATFDLDILIEPSLENAKRLLKAFREAGLGTADLIEPDHLLTQEIAIFKDRVRIDVQTSTPGISFEEAWGRRELKKVGREVAPVLSRADLIASKRASGRRVDLEDVEALESS